VRRISPDAEGKVISLTTVMETLKAQFILTRWRRDKVQEIPCVFIDLVLVPALGLFPVLALLPILNLCSLYDTGQSHGHPRNNNTIPFIALPKPYIVVFARARLLSCARPNHSSAVPSRRTASQRPWASGQACGRGRRPTIDAYATEAFGRGPRRCPGQRRRSSFSTCTAGALLSAHGCLASARVGFLVIFHCCRPRECYAAFVANELGCPLGLLALMPV